MSRFQLLFLLVPTLVLSGTTTASALPSLEKRIATPEQAAPDALGARYGCVLRQLSGGELATVHLLVSSRAAYPAARRLRDRVGAEGVRIGLTTRSHRYRSTQSVLRAIAEAGLDREPSVQVMPELFPLTFHQCPPLYIALPATEVELVERARAIERRFGPSRARVILGTDAGESVPFGA